LFFDSFTSSSSSVTRLYTGLNLRIRFSQYRCGTSGLGERVKQILENTLDQDQKSVSRSW
jgi:hypothetical protein